MRASLRDYVAAYNTLTSLKKTEDSMAQSGGSLDSTVVTASENSAEVFAAFELQSKEFQNVQMDFENYMERLKEDIDVKAGKFEHIDYYDALLRDGNERRKPLITVNPLFAKTSEMPPKPNVEDITYDHISLNLPSIAKNTLRELDEDLVSEPTNSVEVIASNDIVDNSSDIDEVVGDNISNLSSDEEVVIPNDEESLSDEVNNDENIESDEEESDEEQNLKNFQIRN
jgi:hypothetical protein